MTNLIIRKVALSRVQLANVSEFNREHKPVFVTVVADDGYSQRYKLTENEILMYVINDVSNEYFILVK